MAIDEQAAVSRLSELILSAGATLFKATKYIYALSCDCFYSCDVKDIFRVVLNNIRVADNLEAFGLSIDGEDCALLNTEEYDRVFSLIVYSFAARLPVLCRSSSLTEQQLRAVYYDVLEKGVSNIDEAILESFADNRALVKKGKPVQPYSAEWLRAYLYGSYPAIADVSNRSFFFFGAIDVLFVMFYLVLEKETELVLAELEEQGAQAR